MDSVYTLSVNDIGLIIACITAMVIFFICFGDYYFPGPKPEPFPGFPNFLGKMNETYIMKSDFLPHNTIMVSTDMYEKMTRPQEFHDELMDKAEEMAKKIKFLEFNTKFQMTSKFKNWLYDPIF